MATIASVNARQVFDSRGTPTVEVDIALEGGGAGRFITPSGASCGKKEAIELRDGDNKKFNGKGVQHALNHIRTEIATAIVGLSFAQQEDLDRLLIKLDGTPNKSRLGANAILAVSGAFFHAMADQKKQPLYGREHGDDYVMPLPLVNVINGGVHANNGLDIQEFMIVPSGAASFCDAMRMVAEIFYALKNTIASKGLVTSVGDEGGFAPKLKSNEDALDLLMEAAKRAGYHAGRDVQLALDVAASELYDEDKKLYRLNGAMIEREQFLKWYDGICSSYPIISIEDPFHEEDYQGFAEVTKRLGSRVQIVGDDLFVTNPRFIREGIEHRYANAVLIKMNQIGTITETIEATKLAQSAGLRAIISHRSGDSEDCTIADLAIKTGAGQIKTGSLCRSERVAKYNRLLRIEEALAGKAVFAPWCRGV